MAHSRIQGTKNQAGKHKAQTKNKEQTGGWSSGREDINQNELVSKQNFINDEKRFDLVIDGVPYIIRAVPFLYNDEMRFRVIINNDAGHVFTWDSEIKMLRAIDDDASDLPDRLEQAISEKLQSFK